MASGFLNFVRNVVSRFEFVHDRGVSQCFWCVLRCLARIHRYLTPVLQCAPYRNTTERNGKGHIEAPVLGTSARIANCISQLLSTNSKLASVRRPRTLVFIWTFVSCTGI